MHRLTEVIDGALGTRGAVHAVLQLNDHQTREPQPDERLAQTRPTNSAKSIVRVQARARDRRVAYATGQLPGPAPGPDGHREMPIGVARDRADRVCSMQQLLPLAVGDEDGGIAHLQAVLARKPRRAGGCEQDMPPVLHHGDGQVDRMPDVAQAGCTSRAKPRALHDSRIQLDLSVAVQRGAYARVEQRLVLHLAHRGDRGHQGATSDLAPACLEGSLDSGLALSSL